MFQGYLPEYLWSADKQGEVEDWLKENIEDPLLRKIIYLDWCAYFGIEFTVELAVNIGAEELPPP